MLTFDELLTEVWGPEYVGDNLLVRVAMSRLRAKIETGSGAPSHIITRPGVGYMASTAKASAP
ncbi:MAG: helix-turn-helix domain-containing protein [Chloroflexota bacterium]|nr:helix-turn-helix domain-containing protein [Chloroflexota bacterium]MDP6508504.1 helix-turn-helix domain-containing protein [Chloroflexota bacterium]MDP6758440.1 helix-turn-helix domain-containing protein [Chloroflexota bacterium]